MDLFEELRGKQRLVFMVTEGVELILNPHFGSDGMPPERRRRSPAPRTPPRDRQPVM